MEQISVSGTSFLERILRTKKSSMPRCCFVSPHNSLFSLVLIFPSFWAKSLRSQTLVIGGSVWNKKCKCRRNAHAFERSGQSFGFPQIVRAHEKLVQSPLPGWHIPYGMCRSWFPRDTCHTTCAYARTGPTQCHRLVPA